MQQFGKSTLSKYCIMDSYVVYKRKDDKEIKGYKELNFFYHVCCPTLFEKGFRDDKIKTENTIINISRQILALQIILQLKLDYCKA